MNGGSVMRKALQEYIDSSYLAEKRKNPNIKFQVYGTVITGGFLKRYSHVCFIYCENNSVYYHAICETKNIFSNIKELYIHRSAFSKKIIRLKIKADKIYKITIFKYDSFSTNITGSQPQHCQELIEILERKCLSNNGKLKNRIQK